MTSDSFALRVRLAAMDHVGEDEAIAPLSATRPQLLTHDGPCGLREPCWRDDCRREWGDYATVERFPRSGEVLARCHGGRFSVSGMSERAA